MTDTYLWINKLKIKLGDVSCPRILSHTYCWCSFAFQQLAAPGFFSLELIIDSWEKIMSSTLLWTSQFLCVHPPVFLLKKQLIWTFSKSAMYQPVQFFFFWGLQSWLAFSYCPKLHLFWGFPCDTVVKNLPAMQEIQLQSLGQEDPLEKGMAIHSSILAWRISWTEQPGGLQSMGSHRDTAEAI